MPLKCDYCGNVPPSGGVVPLAAVIGFIRKAISGEWCSRHESGSYSSAAEGYMAQSVSNQDVFDEIGLNLFIKDQILMMDIVDAFNHIDWCRRNWYELSPSKRWWGGWESFRFFVMHHRRYTFWHAQDFSSMDPFLFETNSIAPSVLLEEISSVIKDTPLIRLIPQGTRYWRVRRHARNVVLSPPSDFTPPPIDRAGKPNRMSPAGVPMFYGAIEFETAKLEVQSAHGGKKPESLTGVQFMNVVPLNILDLTAIPPLPSYFLAEGPRQRHILTFLKRFSEDVSKPLLPIYTPHIEYVPTQVFTEFVRHVMKASNGGPVHGIQYASSQDGKACCVIFVTQEQCLPEAHPLDFKPPKVLEYVADSLTTVEVTS